MGAGPTRPIQQVRQARILDADRSILKSVSSRVKWPRLQLYSDIELNSNPFSFLFPSRIVLRIFYSLVIRVMSKLQASRCLSAAMATVQNTVSHLEINADASLSIPNQSRQQNKEIRSKQGRSRGEK